MPVHRHGLRGRLQGVVCRGRRGASAGELEPHNPSLDDTFAKAVGVARFAERHGHLFHRIQIILKQASKAGGERLFRLDLNTEVVRKQVLLTTANAQLDAVFGQLAE